MFQLIVAVVGILLIAIMVLAALYWGGSAHTEASIKAQYAGNMNSAAQIEGAMQLYFNDRAVSPPGSDMELLQHLVDTNYLKEIPEGEWVVSTDTLYKPFAPEAQDISVCRAMNKVAGFNVALADLVDEPYEGCPPCNGAVGSPELTLAEKYKGWPGCQFMDSGTPAP